MIVQARHIGSAVEDLMVRDAVGASRTHRVRTHRYEADGIKLSRSFEVSGVHRTFVASLQLRDEVTTISGPSLTCPWSPMDRSECQVGDNQFDVEFEAFRSPSVEIVVAEFPSLVVTASGLGTRTTMTVDGWDVGAFSTRSRAQVYVDIDAASDPQLTVPILYAFGSDVSRRIRRFGLLIQGL